MKFTLHILILFILIFFQPKFVALGSEETENINLKPIGSVGLKMYYIGSEKMYWANTLNLCHRFDYEMASIENEDENSFVAKYIFRNDISFAWISIIDLFSEKVWRWMQTSDRANYTNWENLGEILEPDKYKNCGIIQDNGLWKTTKCSSDKNIPLCQLVRDSSVFEIGSKHNSGDYKFLRF